MSRLYKLYQVDAFTRDKFSGNPAGVISDADGLTEEEMQSIARELNNSETAFLFKSSNKDHDVYTRYFTPTHEVPICGHATIASQYVLAKEKQLENERIHNKTGVGVLPVDIIKNDEDYRIAMTQGKVSFGNILEGSDREELLSCLGIGEDDMMENFSIQIVSTGHSKVMIGLKTSSVLNALKADSTRLARLSEHIKCNGFYVFTLNRKDNDYLVEGRMFAPAIGIVEDPVTGNANGPLGAYLVKYNLASHDNKTLRFKALQGVAINRPGCMEVEVKIENHNPIEVKIIGDAVIAFKCELEL